jgi:hypothetical protein
MNASFHKLAATIASVRPSLCFTMVSPVMFCHLHEHHSALQHWAKISASGATGIEDLNNSTLHFTDVNGSSLSGTTSEVVKQMVAMRYITLARRFPSRIICDSGWRHWRKPSSPPLRLPACGRRSGPAIRSQQHGARHGLHRRAAGYAPACFVAEICWQHCSFLTRSRLFYIAGVSHLHKLDRDAHASVFQVAI